MPQWALGALRTGVQWLVPALLAVLAGWHIRIPDGAGGYLVTALMAAGVAGWTAGVRWLEARPATTPDGRAARALARVLMLGAPPVVVSQPRSPGSVGTGG